MPHWDNQRSASLFLFFVPYCLEQRDCPSARPRYVGVFRPVRGCQPGGCRTAAYRR